jgi:IS1 family transposase
VNDWGWRMFLTPEGIPSKNRVKPITRGEGMEAEQAVLCYSTLFQVAFDGIGFAPEELYKQIPDFPRKPFTHPSFELDSLIPKAKSANNSPRGEESKEEVSSLIESKEDESAVLSAYQNFKIIPRLFDELNVVVTVTSDLKVYEHNSEDSKVVETLSLGQKLLIVEEKNSFVRVKLFNESLKASEMSKIEPKGWVLRRKNEEQFIEADPASSFVEEVVTLQTDKPSASAPGAAKEEKDALHPMYQVLNKKKQSGSVLGGSYLSSNRLLFRDYDFIDQAMCEYAAIATVSYSFDAIHTILTHWPVNIPLLESKQLTLNDLLKYLTEIINKVNNKNLQESQLKLVKEQSKKFLELLLRESKIQTVTEAVSPSIKSKDPIPALVKLSQDILDQSSLSPSLSYEGYIPVKRGKLQVIESAHPYEDNLNKDWIIKFPGGCKKIEIKFAEESCTETNYDYLTIYDLSKDKKLYPQKIHGFKNAANRHFPGVGNVPSVILENCDSCVINFTTDSGTNDWGFKLFAYGIYDYPKEEEIKKYENFLSSKSVAFEKKDHSVYFAIWVFSELTKIGNNLDESTRATLFDISSFRVLITFFNSPSAESFKGLILDIFLVFIQFYSNKMETLLSTEIGVSFIRGLYSDLKELETSLIKISNEKYLTETENGDNLLKISPDLQATVQLLITVGAFISKIEGMPELVSVRKDELPIESITKQGASSTDGWETFVVSHSSRTKASICWDVKINALSPSPSSELKEFPVIGITTDPKTLRSKKVGEPSNIFEIGFSYSSTTNHSYIIFNKTKYPLIKGHEKKWGNGDVISIILDRINGILCFAVNQVLLPILVGPAKLDAFVEMKLINVDAYLVYSLPKSADYSLDVSLNPGLPLKLAALKSSPASVTSTSSDMSNNDWLSAINDLSVLMQNISNHEIPATILSQKFIPFCNKKSSQTISLTNDELNVESTPREESVHFSGTPSSTHLVVQQLELLENDKIDIYADSTKKQLLLTLTHKNNRKKMAFENVDKYIYDITTKYFDKLNAKYKGLAAVASEGSAGGSHKLISVGDKVVRSSKWKYGNEDGGIGYMGVVTKIQEWKEKAGSGITVRWLANEHEGLYRYNYEGISDIELISNNFKSSTDSSSPSHEKKHIANNGTWSCDHGELHLVITLGKSTPDKNQSEGEKKEGKEEKDEKKKEEGGAEGEERKEEREEGAEAENKAERSVKIMFIPLLSMNHCLGDPEFSSLKEKLSKLYIAGKRSYLSELVKHMNNQARTKSIEREELMTKKWGDLLPTTEDFTRSGALKELYDLEAIKFDNESFKLEGLGPDNLIAVYEDKPVDPALLVLSPDPQDGFLAEYALWNGIFDFDDLDSAFMAAKQIYPECRGITLETNPMRYTLRKGKTLLPSPSNEKSWLINVKQGGGDSSTMNNNNFDFILSSSENNVANQESWLEFTRGDSGENAAVIDEQSIELSMEQSGGHDGDEQEEPDHDDNDSSEENNEDHDDEGGEGDDDDEEHEEDDEGGWETVSEESALVNEAAAEATSSVHSTEARSPSASRPKPPTDSGKKKAVCGKCQKTIHRHPAGTWHNGWTCDCPEHVGANYFQGNDPVWGCDTVVSCNWGICETCWKRLAPDASASDSKGFSDSLYSQMLKSEMKPSEALFNIIILLNFLVKKVLPFIDLSREDAIIPGSLTYLLMNNRDLILEVIKKISFEESLERTQATSGQFDLQINRVRAMKLAQAGKTDDDGRWTVFSQAFRLIHVMNPSILRKTDKLYNVKLLGERAQDAGGPYRESFDIYASELQSKALPLFLRTVNGRHAVGYNREKWILNPSAISSTQLEMFNFLGKLMGYSIRSKEYLALNIPSIIWKLLVHDAPTVEDLEGIDFSLVKSMDLLRTIDTTGITRETFSTTFFETFSMMSSDDRMIELKPNGSNIDVTFDNRHEYCDLVIQVIFFLLLLLLLLLRENLILLSFFLVSLT